VFATVLTVAARSEMSARRRLILGGQQALAVVVD